MPLAPNPTTVITDTIFQTVLRSALGPVLIAELLIDPPSAGGRSEAAFEIANKKRDLKQFQEAIRRYQARCGRALSRDEQRRLHDAITKQDLTMDEIADYAESLFGCPAQQNPH